MPLAHLLLPQLAQKVNEIETSLGRAGYLSKIAPAPVTYSQDVAPSSTPPNKMGTEPASYSSAPRTQDQNIGFEKTPYDPRGLMDKPKEKSFDSRNKAGGVLEGIGIMQRSGDPVAQKVARAFLGGAGGQSVGVQGNYETPRAGQSYDAKGKKSAGYLAGTREPIGMNERGEPVYATVATPAPASKTGRGGTPASKTQKLAMKKGQNVGFDETGESVDPKGKKLGYLASPGAPRGSIAGSRGDAPLTDLARRKTDAPMDGRDVYGAQALKQMYGDHLKARQDHFSDTGREEFPPGYFNGLTPEQRQSIEHGVESLRLAEKGQST